LTQGHTDGATCWLFKKICYTDYVLIKYKKTGSARGESTISITKHNSFGFSSRFAKDNLLSQFKYTILFFDPELMEIGFQFTSDENEKDKYAIFGAGDKPGGYGGNIVCTSFFKDNHLVPNDYKGQYRPEKRQLEGIGELFVIKLSDKTVEITGSPSEAQPTT